MQTTTLYALDWWLDWWWYDDSDPSYAVSYVDPYGQRKTAYRTHDNHLLVLDAENKVTLL